MHHDQEGPVAESLPDDSSFLPTSCTDNQRLVCDGQLSLTPQDLRKVEIFHERQLWEASCIQKSLAREEQALISINPAEVANAPGIATFDEAVFAARMIDFLSKAARDNSRSRQRV